MIKERQNLDERLIKASKNNSTEEIRQLISQGANVNATDKDGETPLMKAIENNHIQATQVLLELKADINFIDSQGWSYLHIAAIKGSYELIKVLINSAANLIDKQEDTGLRTSLHIAANDNNTEAIKCLLESEAKIDIGDINSKTPLHYAARNGHIEAIKVLLEYGANVNEDDNRGETSIHLATQEGHIEAIKVLLESKADINEVNKKGLNPLDIAIGNGKAEVIDFLLINEANYDKAFEKGNPEIKSKINKIRATHELYDGSLSIAVEEINQEYLKNLCRKSGVPRHLLEIDKDCPESIEYCEIVQKFLTKEDEIKSDLNVFIGKLLNIDNPSEFPEILGFDFLANKRFADIKESGMTTMASYEEKPYLKPTNFFKKKYLKEKLAILLRNPQLTENFFLSTEKYILPKQQHEALQELKKVYYQYDPALKLALNQQHRENLRLQETIEQQQKLLEQLAKALSKIPTKTESGLSTEEASKELPKESSQKLITNYFSRVEEPSLSPVPDSGKSSLKRMREGGESKSPSD